MKDREFLDFSKNFIFSKNKQAVVKDMTEKLILGANYRRVKYTKKLISNLRKLWF